MFRQSFLLFALVFLIGSAVFAQGIAFGPQLGFQKARDADEGKLMIGGAIRAKLSPALGIEGSINYRHENYGEDFLTVRSWPVMLTGMFYPFPVIYAAMGAGWYNTTFDYAKTLNDDGIDDETTQEVGWHFGGGVEIPFGELTKVKADIRYVFLDYDFNEIPGRGGTKSDFYMITIGLLIGM